MKKKNEPEFDLSKFNFDLNQYKYGILNNNLLRPPPGGGYPVPPTIEESKKGAIDWEKLLKEWNKGKK